MSEAVRVKRFYKEVEVKPHGDGVAVFLDGKTAKTKGRRPLAAPARALIDAVAAEWNAQEDELDLRSMPLTRLLSAVLDGEETSSNEWRDETLNYLSSDLLCYRAEMPAALVERQQATWDPYLDWFEKEFGAALTVTCGISAAVQPDAATASVLQMVEELSSPSLFAIYMATRLNGSAVLALALWKKAETPEAVFKAARLDEHFQEERWGEDAEAKEREQDLEREFLAIACFMRLLEEA